jgi:hypothetical protein
MAACRLVSFESATCLGLQQLSTSLLEGCLLGLAGSDHPGQHSGLDSGSERGDRFDRSAAGLPPYQRSDCRRCHRLCKETRLG